jgi:hypothetical protein
MFGKRWILLPWHHPAPAESSRTGGPALTGHQDVVRDESAVPVVPADEDGHARVRMQLAALMLLRGDDIADVAAATDVPAALLELLRVEVTDDVDDAALDRQRRATARRMKRGRQVVIAVLLLEVAAVANIVVGVTALIGHVAGLGLLASLVSAALILVVYAVARYATPPGSRTAHRRCKARRDGGGRRGFRQ